MALVWLAAALLAYAGIRIWAAGAPPPPGLGLAGGRLAPSTIRPEDQ